MNPLCCDDHVLEWPHASMYTHSALVTYS